DGLTAGRLAVEHAQRVPCEARLALIAQAVSNGRQVLDQAREIRRSRSCVADGVDMERESVGKPERAEEVDQHGDHFRVERRMCLAERLDVRLMELTVASCLRALVAKHRAEGVEPNGLRLHVKAMLDVRSEHRGRRFGTKGQRIPASVLERVHLFLDDIRLIADAAPEQLRALEERTPDLAIAVGLEDAPAGRFDALPTFHLAGQNVAYATDGFDRRHQAFLTAAGATNPITGPKGCLTERARAAPLLLRDGHDDLCLTGG